MKPAKPLHPHDLTKGEWVQVYYEGKKFLGKVVSVTSNGQINVRYLEKPFGVREAQQLEREDDTCFYIMSTQLLLLPIL